MPSTIGPTINDPYARRQLTAGIFLTILLLIILIGEAMRDRFVRFWLGVVLFCVVVLIASVALLVGAKAHDANHPERTEWFKSLKSGKGMCCDGYDALHLKEVDWETQNKEHSHIRVRVPAKGDDMAKAAMGEEV